MKKVILAIPAALLLLSAAPAGPAIANDKKPQEMMEEGGKLIIDALRLMIKSIPQYRAPEVLENGDIIIRRVQPGEKPAKPEKDDNSNNGART